MHYKILVKTNTLGDDIVEAWYAGRKTGDPTFEIDISSDNVLRYYYYDNVKDDSLYLEQITTLCHDVKIVAFNEDGQMLPPQVKDTFGKSTIEIDQGSPLEVLGEVQQILSQIVSSGKNTELSREQSHEQTRIALSLVLKAISILNKQEYRAREEAT